MAGGVVLLTFRTSGTDAAAKKARQVGEELDAAGSKAKSGASKMSGFTSSLDDALGKLMPFDTHLGAISEGLDKFEGKLGDGPGKLKAWGAGLGVAAGAAGLGVGAALSNGIMSAIELDDAKGVVSAQLGLTEAESARIGKVAGAVYAQNYGESLTQVSDVAGQVISSIEGMGDANEATLSRMTENALNFAKTFEQDTGRVTQIVGQMLTTGLAKDADEAFDLLTASMQAVPSNVRDDLMDAADEYGPFFSQLGLGGEEAFGLLAKGAEQGMYGIDKTGDALKELTIRSTDMSASSVAAYDALGLSAEDMTARILAGGDDARGAFDQIIGGLLSMEDPAAQSQAALALFGTPLEDLGTDKIPGFLSSLRDGTSALGDFEGAAGRMDEALQSGASSGWQEMGRAFEGVTLELGERLLPLLEPVTDWMKENPGLMTVLVVGLGALAVALGIAAAAVWAVNSALFASPITWIILGVVALVAAVVALWMNWDAVVGWITEVWGGFTEWLGGQWAEICGFFTAAYENVIRPVFEGIGAAATWLYENAIRPAFEGIAAAMTWVWETIILPIVGFVVNWFRFWGAVAVWLWENAILPAFQAIGDFMVFIWESYLKPVVDGVVFGFQKIGEFAVWLWEEKILPVFQALGEFMLFIWETFLKPVVDGVASGFGAIGDAATWLWENGIQPAFQSISDFMWSTWTWIDENIFTPFKSGIDKIVEGFKTGATAIGEAWDGIKGAAARPINFILGTVWNDGLRSFWNDVVTELGLEDMKLAKAPLVEFAEGGVMPGYTPGRDVHQFYSPTAGFLALSGGEAIMRPEFTRAVGGPAGVDRLNAAARRGEPMHAFADGGTWDPFGALGDFASDVWNTVTSAAQVAWEFLSDPAGAIKTHVVDGIIRPLLGGGGNILQRAIGELPVQLVEALVGRFGGSSVEAPPGAGTGSAGMGWEAMWSLIHGADPGIVMTSNYRPGSRTVNGGQSYHALGRAIDLIPATMETFNRVAAMFPNASELIFTPAGNRQLLNGQPFSGWSPAVKAQHYNHVHLAMADGGVFPMLAGGGPVKKGNGYIVGDGGVPEFFVPDADGYVYPSVPAFAGQSASDISASLDDVDVQVGPRGDRTIVRVVTVDGRILAETVFDEAVDEEARL